MQSGPKPPLHTGPSPLPPSVCPDTHISGLFQDSSMPRSLQAGSLYIPNLSKVTSTKRPALISVSSPPKPHPIPQIMHNLDLSLPGTQHDIITCLSVIINKGGAFLKYGSSRAYSNHMSSEFRRAEPVHRIPLPPPGDSEIQPGLRAAYNSTFKPWCTHCSQECC